MAAAGTGHDMVLRMLADTNQYLREIRKAQTATHVFKDTVAGAARFIRDTMSTAFGVMGGNFLTGAISGITSRVWEWVRGGFALNSVLIESRESFGVMFGSVREGNALVDQLYQYAAKTVYEFENINKAAGILAASGVGVSQILPVLRTLGELGNTSTRPIEQIAALYAKIKSSGRITGEERRQFSALGIPIEKELARVMGVAQNELADLMEKGKVGYTQFQIALQNLTKEGSQFYEMQKKLSLTVPGIWATLKDSFKMAAAQLAESLIEIFDLKTLMKQGINLGDWMKQIIKQWTPTVKAWWEWFRANAANVFWDVTAKALDFTAKLIEGAVKYFLLFESVIKSIESTIAKLTAFMDSSKLKALLMVLAPGATVAIEQAWGMSGPDASTLPVGGSGKPKPKTAGDIAMEAAAALRSAATAAAANVDGKPKEGARPTFGPQPPNWPMRIEPGQTGKPAKEKEDRDRDVLAKALSGKDAYQAIYDAMKEQANTERQKAIEKNTADTAQACQATAARMAQVADDFNLLAGGITGGM